MDVGVQATHISNQAIIFALHPAARNRINTVYMVSYFIGGSYRYVFGHFAVGQIPMDMAYALSVLHYPALF
jgi:hypothetical protein